MPHGRVASSFSNPDSSSTTKRNAVVHVQRIARGRQGRKKALDALILQMETEEKFRQARQLAQLEEGFELLAQVADERKVFERAIVDRSNHWHTQKGTKAEAAVSIQRCFRRHKIYVQMWL